MVRSGPSGCILVRRIEDAVHGSRSLCPVIFRILYLVFMTRMAFKTAETVTPTSAKTASQMVAIPPAPRRSTTALMPIAKTIFCQTIFRVLLAIFIALTIFEGSSVISTTSAAFMAASEPTPPIAIPTSARARTGASSMPRLRRCRLRWSAWHRKDVNRYMKNYSYVFCFTFRANCKVLQVSIL